MCLDLAAAGDPVHQRSEQQRRNDGPDQPQKDRAEQTHLLGRVRCENPERYAGGHADKDPSGQRNPLHRSPHFNFCRSTSKNICLGGRIRCSA